MITDPISVNNSSAVAQSFKRTSQNGATSDWINSTTNTVTDRGTLRVAHQRFGKGGVSRRSLLQITRTKVNATTGVSELVTCNVTFSQPDIRQVMSDTELDDIKAEIYNFFGNATLWGNFKLGES